MERHTWEDLILMDREGEETMHDKVEYRKESVQDTFQTLITQTCLSFEAEDIHFEDDTSGGEESVVSCILKSENGGEEKEPYYENIHYEDTSEGEESIVHSDCTNERKESEVEERDIYSEDVDALIETWENEDVDIEDVTDYNEDTCTVRRTQRNDPKKCLIPSLAFCRRCEEGPVCCVEGSTTPWDERKDMRECVYGMNGKGGAEECAIEAHLNEYDLGNDTSKEEHTKERGRIYEVEKEQKIGEETQEEEYYSEKDLDYGEYDVLETVSPSWNSHEDIEEEEEEEEEETLEDYTSTQPHLQAPDTYYRCQEPLEVILEILGEEGDEEGRHRGIQDIRKIKNRHSSHSEDDETLCGSEELSADSLEVSLAPQHKTTWCELAKNTSETGIPNMCSDAETHTPKTSAKETISTRSNKSQSLSTKIKGREVSDRDKLRCLTSEIEEYLKETTLLLESANSYCTPRKREDKTPLQYPINGSVEGRSDRDADTQAFNTVMNNSLTSSSLPQSPHNNAFPYVNTTDDRAASPLASSTGGTETSLDILDKLWAPITGHNNTTDFIEGREGNTDYISLNYSTPERRHEEEIDEQSNAERIFKRNQDSDITSIYQSLTDTKGIESQYFSAIEASNDAVDALEWEENNTRTRGPSPIIYIPSQRIEVDDYFFTSLDNAGDNWLPMYDEPGECLESPSLPQLSTTFYEADRTAGMASTFKKPSIPPPPPPRHCIPPPLPPPPRPESPPPTVSCLASLEKLCNTWTDDYNIGNRQTFGFTELQRAMQVGAESVSENVESETLDRFENSDNASLVLHNLVYGVNNEEMHEDELNMDRNNHDIYGVTDRLESENGTSLNIRGNEKVKAETKKIPNPFRISARLEEIFREAERETCILTTNNTFQSPLLPLDDKNNIEDNNLIDRQEEIDLQRQLDEILNRMDALYEEHLGDRTTGGDDTQQLLETRTQRSRNNTGRLLETQTWTQSSEKTAFQDIINISEDLKHICMFHVNKNDSESYQPNYKTTIAPPTPITTTTISTTTTTLPSTRRQSEEGTVRYQYPDEGGNVDSCKLIRFLQEYRARNLQCYDLPVRYLKEMLMYSTDGGADGAASTTYNCVPIKVSVIDVAYYYYYYYYYLFVFVVD